MEWDRHLYQVEILQCPNRETVLEKCVQSGFSEVNICRMFGELDQGFSCFYVQPTVEIRGRHVTKRIDPVIDNVPYYRAMMDRATATKRAGRGASDAVIMKQIGTAFVTFVGSNQLASFGEDAADSLFVDEYDKCNRDALILADDRIGSSDRRVRHVIGNPTLEGTGIDAEFESSSKGEWHVRCGHCGDRQPLDWFANVVRDLGDHNFAIRAGETPGLVCRSCNGAMDRYGPGEWVHEHPDRDIRGWRVSQLFSGTVPFDKMWLSWLKAQGDQTQMARFFNSILGRPHSTAEAALNDAVLNRMVAEYPAELDTPQGGIRVAGVDIGDAINVIVIDPGTLRWERGVMYGTARVVAAIELTGDSKWSRLETVLRQYKAFAVIDARPEYTKALEVQGRIGKGRLVLAEHIQSEAAKDLDYEKKNRELGLVQYRLTHTMDQSHAAIVTGHVAFFKGAGAVPNLWDQMKGRVREIVDEDTQTARWLKKGPEHFRMAFNFAWMALRLKSRSANVFVETL